jgi:hypothetical protein
MTAPVPNPTDVPESPRRQPKRAPGEPLVNYTKIPNGYDELVDQNKLVGALQRDIVWKLARHTWGSEERPEYAPMSGRQIAKICHADPANTHRALADMTERGILEATQGKGCRNQKFYKLTPDKWKDARPPAPEVAATEPEPTPDDVPAAAEKVPQTAPPSNDKLIVRPGTKGKRPYLTACLALPGRDPLDVRIEFENTGAESYSAAIRTENDALVFSGAFLPERRTDSESTAVYKQRSTLSPAENTRLTDFSAAISRVLLSELEIPFFLDNPLDMTLALNVLEKAGPDLPPEVFEAYCHRHFAIMRKKRLPLSPGLLPAFAEQAAFQHKGLKVLREQEAKNRPAPPPPPTFTPEEIAELAQIVAQQALLCDFCKGTGEHPHARKNQNGKQIPLECDVCSGTGKKDTA